MGGSSSKSSVTQNISNLQISKTDMNLLNQSINEFVSTNITKAASSCAASSAQTDTTEIGDIVAKGAGSEVKIGVESDQKTNITLQCLQQSLQQTNINNNIATAIVQQLTKNIGQDAMTKLVSDAESKAKQGMGGIGFSSSNSKINTNVTNTNLAYTNVKLENLVKNTVQNKTENKNIQECGTKISQNLSKKIGNIIALEGAKVEVQFTNKQVIESIAKCQQLNSQVSDITSSIANSLGFTVTEETKQKTDTASEAKSKSTAETEGVGGMLGALFAALMGPYALSAIGICCCIISVIVVIIVIMKMGGSSNTENQETSQDEQTEQNDQQSEQTEQTDQTEQDNQQGGYYIKQFIKNMNKINKNKF
jgi:hypothetical protein